MYDESSRISKDKNLSHSAFRLYMIIKSECNDDGFCVSTNKELGEFLNGSTKSTIQRIINDLVDAGYLEKIAYPEKNDMYKKNYHRVLWIKSAYLKYKEHLRKERHFAARKTPANDKIKFVEFLREEKPSMVHTIKHKDGHEDTYEINKFDGNLWRTSGLVNETLTKEEANKIYKILFWGRFTIFELQGMCVVNEVLSEEQRDEVMLKQDLSDMNKGKEWLLPWENKE